MGYIFLSLSREGKISSRGLEATTAKSRLNLYSAELRGQLCRERFILLGFRSGSAVSLALADVGPNDTMDDVGWKNSRKALHFIKLRQVVNPAGAGAKLADLHPDTGKVYKSLDCLKGFSQAF